MEEIVRPYNYARHILSIAFDTNRDKVIEEQRWPRRPSHVVSAMNRITYYIVTLVVLSIFFAPLGCQTVGNRTSDVTVTTDSGQIEGKLLASGVKAYLGVPFAAPPVGDLRWREPQPVEPWEGVYHADRKMQECIQVLRPHNINHYFGEEPTGENCLFMNIWTPSDATPESNLPVIVFIYGGGGTIGSSGMALYDGEQVANRGAVYVNFNYRVGILGFMAHPELTEEQGGHSGNYAYLDQNAALKWINRNIEQFGGDPEKVIISGQSAGAGAVVQQTFSPLSKGLFRGAVMWSSCNWTGDNSPLAEAEQTGLAIQEALGATNIHDMRQVPADRILAIQSESQVGASVQGFRTRGVIDGYFMPKTKAEILEAGEFNDVPIIASYAHDEASIQLRQATTVEEYNAMAAEVFGDAAAQFLELYPVSSADEIRAVAQAAANDGSGLNSSCTCAELQDQYGESRAYITVFARKHPYHPGVEIADQDPETIGAYHTSEVPYYFGTQDKFNMFRTTRDWTPWDRELSEEMTATLIAFANTGDPSTPDVEWPAWTADNPQYISFGDAVEVKDVNPERMEFMSEHRPARGAPPPRPAGSPRD